MLLCSNLEPDDMANENRTDQRAAPERELPKDLRSSSRPLPQSGPPILNDGLESPRSSDC
jgi:hypothetical protein